MRLLSITSLPFVKTSFLYHVFMHCFPSECDESKSTFRLQKWWNFIDYSDGEKHIWLVAEPTHPKKCYIVKLHHFPRGETTKLLKSAPWYQKMNFKGHYHFVLKLIWCKCSLGLANILWITSICNYVELIFWVCLKKSRLTGNCSTPSHLLKHQPYEKRRPQKKSTPEMVHFSSQKPSQTTGFLGVLNGVPVNLVGLRSKDIKPGWFLKKHHLHVDIPFRKNSYRPRTWKGNSSA